MSTLLRYAPIRNITHNLFDGRRYASNQPRSTASRFPVDVVEGEDSYELKAELPGLNRKDFHVSAEKGVLTLSAEREAPKQPENDRYSHYEREHGKFERAFTLPEHVDPSSIEASYVDGVLRLTIRKTEISRPRKVDIKVN